MQFCIASLLGGNLPSMFSFSVGEDPSHKQYDRRGKNAYALSVEVSLTGSLVMQPRHTQSAPVFSSKKTTNAME